MAPDRHVVFTNGRSGSNFLVDCLNQHPRICNYGEVLGSYMPSMKLHERFGYGGPSVEAYLDFVLSARRHFEVAQVYSAISRLRRGKRARRKRWSNLASLGIKDFAIRFDERGVRDYLSSRPSIRVISLHRENTVRRAISLRSLLDTGVVQVERPGDSGLAQLEVDVDDFVDMIKVLEEEKLDQLALVDALDQDRCFRLTYEELFASEARTRALVGQIYRFLGVEARPIRFNQRKILPLDLRATILNYSEVERGLLGAGFDHYLPGSR